MRILDITPITDTAQIKIKKGTLQFIQDAHKETMATAIQALIGTSYDPTVMYILYGCKNTGSGSSYIIGEGAVFYSGEVYLANASSFTLSGSNVALFNLVITQYSTNADPVTFTDSSTHNVHNIRKMQVGQGISGSGVMDYSAVQFLNFNIPAQLNLTATGLGSISGTYPNLSVDVATPAYTGVKLLWVGTISSTGGTIVKQGGLSTISVTSVTHSGTGIYVINHNVGSLLYYADGIVADNTDNTAVLKQMKNFASGSFQVQTAGNAGQLDASFQLRIYGY
ncbi:hypothetical protein UFOVP153_46 [uncultured Caudovirales phage]|uniref:Uncharacterized protein n=1 Tax=uncultured Caudovirales phage TaxID=2100421 RepID=A0A6J5KY39_9CAUD|nr:hypothetical protein UFOVP69_12 [uncultured Caudovirales phage]CAB5170918.1 hypothetical protein UFOVP153_46 [uncultured Caudovirales phage]